MQPGFFHRLFDAICVYVILRSMVAVWMWKRYGKVYATPSSWIRWAVILTAVGIVEIAWWVK